MENLKKFNEYLDFILERKNKPSDEKLWQKALRWVKGTRHGNSSSVRHNGETHQSPNDGKGFEIYPSAYANSAAAKKYKEWGGTWVKNESINEKKVITKDIIIKKAKSKNANKFLLFLQKNDIDYRFTMDSITTPGLTEVILKDFDDIVISYDYKDEFIKINEDLRDWHKEEWVRYRRTNNTW